MSPAETELDLSLPPNAEQIRRKEFATTRRGYDPDQVRSYLRLVSQQVSRLEEEVRTARLEGRSAEKVAGGDPYEELGARVAEIVRTADEKAQEVLRHAKEEARRVLTESRADAERIVSEARGEAGRLRTEAQTVAERARREGDEFLGKARREADQALSSLTARRDELTTQLEGLRERLLRMAGELEGGTVVESTAAEPIAPAPGTGEQEAPGEAADRRGAPTDAVEVSTPNDPDVEDPWSDTETIHVDIPEIPPLDVSEEPGDGR